MTPTRTERDLLGTLELPADALHGIHTARALANFGGEPPTPASLIQAYAAVKLAAVRTNHELGHLPAATAAALEAACEEVMAGAHREQFPVSALQGGAGTSLNLNLNEVLANLALRRLGRPLGDYATISPLDTVNLHQSTNDTYPTALRIAAIRGCRQLDQDLNALQAAFQELERRFPRDLKMGRTELMDAVPLTFGRAFGAMAEAFARDRWRVFKCEERLRVVNLGGTAIGTGLGAPRAYIFLATERLREITGLGLARAENLLDATQNADVFAEVSGMLRTVACNLLKTSGDLRLMASGPECGLGEIHLPPRQAGSSIMPGKVNPVLPEHAACVAMQVLAQDAAVVQAVAAGQLELNAFLPVVAYNLLGSLELLHGLLPRLTEFCVRGITLAGRPVSPAATAWLTALVPHLGYESCCRIAARMRETGAELAAAAQEVAGIAPETLAGWLTPEQLMRLGHPGPDQ
ncbi:MAG: aspartate ammonia-lyase [Lentisphaeria bacterium]|jgi:aspartate ammonia-lyase